MNNLLTSSLLDSIKNKISLPAEQERFSDANILAMADEFIVSELVPHLMNLNLDLLTVSEDITVVSGKKSYNIPKRAISKVLRAVRYNNGESLGYAALEDSYIAQNGGQPYAVAFQGDYFLPIPSPSSGTFQVSYACAVSSLVPVSECGLVNNVNTGAGIVSITNTPSTFVTTVKFDIVSQDGRILQKDILASDISSNQMTFASLSDELQIGDYVCLARESCVITLPSEAVPVIAESVCLQIIKSQGDVELFNISNAQYEKMWKMFKTNMSPKLVNKTPKIGPNCLYNNFRNQRLLNNRGY